MKTFILFLILTIQLTAYSYGQINPIKYWVDLNDSQKTEILEQCKSTLIKDFYEGKLRPTDDDKTSELLGKLVAANDTILPLAFYLFNNICSKSDGALSEMVADVCADFLFKRPQYIITFFSREKIAQNHELLWEKYARYVAYVLSWREYVLSGFESDSEFNYRDYFEYNYQDYKEKLSVAVQGNKENEETLKIFWQAVDEAIKSW